MPFTRLYENYKTENVAHWISTWLSDPEQYEFEPCETYDDFIDQLPEVVGGKLMHRTPDGVAWGDETLDDEALDFLVRSLLGEAP